MNYCDMSNDGACDPDCSQSGTQTRGKSNKHHKENLITETPSKPTNTAELYISALLVAAVLALFYAYRKNEKRRIQHGKG